MVVNYHGPVAAAISVLLVGTFHFTSKRNLFDNEVDDMRSPERQRQLDEVADRLSRYAPTRVVVERPYAETERVNQDYRAYRSGDRALGPDEREQIGFRLAACCDHARIYPVDILGQFMEPGLEDLVARDEQMARLWEQVQREGTAAADELNRRIAEQPLAIVLRQMNTPRAREDMLRPYTRYFVRLVDTDGYLGADMVGNWYHRNARIYANICKISHPGDRLAVIYGAGHIPVLAHYMTTSGLFELEDPLRYLG